MVLYVLSIRAMLCLRGWVDDIKQLSQHCPISRLFNLFLHLFALLERLLFASEN